MKPIPFFLFLLCFLFLSAAPDFASGGDPARTKELLEVLQSPAADLHAKARACQQAGEFGTEEIVPALASLLGDEHLAAYARSGLENIPGNAAAAALRTALGSLKGGRLLGVIDSLGVLRDAQATAALCRLVADPAPGVAGAALRALGRIANEESIAAIRAAWKSAPAGAEWRVEAVAAGLLAAERQWELGKLSAAQGLYDELRALDLPEAFRAAAARGAILTRGPAGLALLLDHLRSEDAVLREVALRAGRELPGAEVTAALVTELGKAKPGLQEQLVRLLVDRGDAKALPAIETLTGSAAAEVRLAALQSLARIGGASSVPLLLQRVSGAREEESAAALASLIQIRAEGTDAEILKQIPGADAKTRASLIEVLGDRNAVQAVPGILLLAKDPDAQAAAAAFKTLAVLAGPKEVPALLAAALAAPEGPVRSQAERAVYLTSLRVPPGQRIEPVLHALRGSASAEVADKKTLIRLLGLFGTQPACEAVQAIRQDGDEAVREAAFRALVDWPDASAMEVLMSAAKSEPTPAHRILALRGAIRIASREYKAPGAASWFGQINGLVASAADKRLILPGLVLLAEAHEEGLRLLEPYLNDPEVAQEAASAVVGKANAVVKGTSQVKQPEVLKTLLERVASGSPNKSLSYEAASLAKRMGGQ